MDAITDLWILNSLNQGWIHLWTMIGAWVSASATMILAAAAVWTARRSPRLRLDVWEFADQNQVRVDIVNLGWRTEVVDEISVSTGLGWRWDKWRFRRAPGEPSSPIEGWTPNCPSTRPHVPAGQAIQFRILKREWDERVIPLVLKEPSGRATIVAYVWARTASGYRKRVRVPADAIPSET